MSANDCTVDNATVSLLRQIVTARQLHVMGDLSRSELEEFVRRKMVELQDLKDRKERLMEAVEALEAKSKLVINQCKASPQNSINMLT